MLLLALRIHVLTNTSCCLSPRSTLSKCGHAVVATLYPFTWQHTYIPVLPASMIDIVCSPTPFLIGILSCSLTQLQDLPIEEVRSGKARGEMQRLRMTHCPQWIRLKGQGKKGLFRCLGGLFILDKVVSCLGLYAQTNAFCLSMICQ